LPRGTKLQHIKTTTKTHTEYPKEGAVEGAEAIKVHNHTHHMKIV